MAATALIRFFRDRTVFWNPGDAFATTDELLEPTAKEVRNPSIVAAFRRIGLSEQAGTGMRAIFRNWRGLGYVPPVIVNDKARKTFELILLREELLNEDQRLFQAQLGVRLDEMQASLLAFACRERQVSLTDAKAVTGRPRPEARRALDTLVVQRLMQSLGDGACYRLADHLQRRSAFAPHGGSPGDQEQEASADIVTSQAGVPAQDLITDQVIRHLTDHQRDIIKACDVPRSLTELMESAGVTHRSFFRRKHLKPLLDAGICRMTNPTKPRAANQKYVLTEAGVELKAGHMSEQPEE